MINHSSRTFGALLALAALPIWVAVPIDRAAGKGPKGGEGKTEIRLARILHLDSPGIQSHTDAPSGWDPMDEVLWDYWDFRDSILALNPERDPCRIDVSGGGRVKYFTTGQRDCWLTFNFVETPGFPHPSPYPGGPNIDQQVYSGKLYAPEIDPDPMIDNVKTTITLSVMFKKNATRQPLDIPIRAWNEDGGGWPGTGWSLHSVNDLYIWEDSEDPDVRILTTMNPETMQHDATVFELWNNGQTVGVYQFPLTWTMRIVPAP